MRIKDNNKNDNNDIYIREKKTIFVIRKCIYSLFNK